jgi:hypothetical protein
MGIEKLESARNQVGYPAAEKGYKNRIAAMVTRKKHNPRRDAASDYQKAAGLVFRGSAVAISGAILAAAAIFQRQ